METPFYSTGKAARSLLLRHVCFEVFEASIDSDESVRPAGIEVQFLLDTRGGVSTMRMRLEPAAPSLSFVRREN